MNGTESPELTGLRQRYGAFMTSEEAARELRFNSTSALRMACKRQSIELSPIKVAGRRGVLYATDEVASVVSRWLDTRIKQESEM